MNKLILASLLALSFSATAGSDEKVTTSSWGESNYVTGDRFIKTAMANPMDYVITDTKTGCQYSVITWGSGVSQEPLGCFEEYKKK